MSNIKKNLLALSLIPSFLLADATLDELKKLPMLNNPNVQLLDYKKIDKDWYLIKARTMTKKGVSAPLNFFTNKKYLAVGKLFDMAEQKEISFFNPKEIKEKSVFSIGTGNEEYFLFTDIECPYCTKYDDMLSKVKKELGKHVNINVYFYPLDFHLFSQSASEYIISLPKEQRESETSKLMELIKNNKLDEAIIITSKYNNSFYTKLMNGLSSNIPNQKALAKRYVTPLLKAFKKVLNIDSEKEIVSFLQELIKKTPTNLETTKQIMDLSKFAQMEMNINGTPTLINSKSQIIDPYSPIIENGIINVSALNKLKAENKTIPYGIGKEELYIVLAATCPSCIDKIKNKTFMKKLYENYKVDFVLISLDGSEKSINEISTILSMDKKDRFNAMQKVMTGEPFDLKANLNFNHSLYVKQIQEALIMGTPTIVSPTKGIIKTIDFKKGN